MSDLTSATEEASGQLSWGLVTRHAAGGDCAILFGSSEETLGVSEEDLREKGLEAFIVGQAPTPAPWREPTVDTVRFLIRDAKGRPRWLESRSRQESDGQILMATHGLLTPALEESLLANARVSLGGSLLGPIAHEVNNVVQGISCAEFLLRDSIESDQPIDVEDIDQLTETASLLTKLAAALQRYARLEFREPEELQLHWQVDDAMSLLRTTGVAKTIDVDLQVADAQTAVVWSAAELNLLLSALFANAAEAARQGPDPRVSVSARVEGGTIELAVRNSGSAFDPSSADHPFVTSKPRHRHAGLGLTAATAIVTHHGGTLRYVQPECGGTEVRVEVPADIRKLKSEGG